MKCPYCNQEIQITLAKVTAIPPATPPPAEPELKRVSNPTALIQVPVGGAGYVRDLNYECFLQSGVLQIAKYGFYKSSTDRPPIILMAGSRRDGTAPPGNPEHTGGRSLDCRYPRFSDKTINYTHINELLEAWDHARNVLFPKATIKVKMFKEYVHELEGFYDTEYLSIRLVGDEDDPTGDRDHKEHFHVNIMGVR